MRKMLVRLNEGEEGHAMPFIGVLIAGVGTINLGIGAANGTGWLAVAGGIVAFFGLAVASVLNHTKVEYDIYDRLDKLEGKNKQ